MYKRVKQLLFSHILNLSNYIAEKSLHDKLKLITFPGLCSAACRITVFTIVLSYTCCSLNVERLLIHMVATRCVNVLRLI